MPMSDKEQVQVIKDLWKEYGNYLLFTLFIFVLANVGWRYWQKYHNTSAENASVVYMQMVSSMEKKKPEESKLFAEQLIKDYSKSQYASLAALTLAKDAVEAGDLQAAQEKLQFVVKKSPNKGIKQMARIREARVLIAMDKSREALDLLNTVDDAGYESETSEVFGDALMALGKVDEAKKAYQKAYDSSDDKMKSPLLKMKMRQF